jgi:hypothetical protein
MLGRTGMHARQGKQAGQGRQAVRVLKSGREARACTAEQASREGQSKLAVRKQEGQNRQACRQSTIGSQAGQADRHSGQGRQSFRVGQEVWQAGYSRQAEQGRQVRSGRQASRHNDRTEQANAAGRQC